MAPLVASALIGAGSSLVGGLLGSLGQSNANKSNERINERNLQWQEEMWNKTNEYNTPAAQRQRLLAAGINPLSAIGGVNNSQAQNLGAPSMLPMQNSMDALGQGISDAGVKAAQVANLNADTKKKESESLLTDEQKIQLQWSNKFVKDTYNARTTTELSKLYAEQLSATQSSAMLNMFLDELNKDGSSLPDSIITSFYANYDAIAKQLVLLEDKHEQIQQLTSESRAKVSNMVSMMLLAYATYKQTGDIASSRMAVDKYISDNNLEGQKISANAIVTSAGITASSNQKIASQNNASMLERERMQQATAYRGQDKQQETAKYQSDNQLRGTMDTNDRNLLNIASDAVKGFINQVQGDSEYRGFRLPSITK